MMLFSTLGLAQEATEAAATTQSTNESLSAGESGSESDGEIDINTGNLLDSLQVMINNFLRLLPKLILGIIVLVIFIFLGRLTKRIVRKSTGGSGIGKAFGRLAQLAVMLGGLMLALIIAFPSVKPATVLSGLGVGGVAIGFAFKDILQNYFAGILLLWREPFTIGDQIETSGGHVGTIQAIQTRATTLKTYDGRRVVIPNSNLFTDTVTVNTGRENRRSQYDVGIGYGDDIEKARAAMLEEIKSIEGVLTDPAPDVLVVNLGDFAVSLRGRWWTDPERGNVIKIQDQVLTAVKLRLDKEGIDMPYPTNITLFHDQTEATDGDRSKQREGWTSREDDPQPRYKAT